MLAPSSSLTCQHLRVLLLVLAQHLRHRHQGLDLGHLPADVDQLREVRLTDVVDSGQVPGRVTLNTRYRGENIVIRLTFTRSSSG